MENEKPYHRIIVSFTHVQYPPARGGRVPSANADSKQRGAYVTALNVNLFCFYVGGGGPVAFGARGGWNLRSFAISSVVLLNSAVIRKKGNIVYPIPFWGEIEPGGAREF